MVQDLCEFFLEKTIEFDLVADIYDSYVDVDFDLGFYKDFCKYYGSILELMYGTGRVSLPLIESGFTLTCVDYSQGMLDVFHSKLKPDMKADIHCQNVCELDLDRQCDLVMIPFNTIAKITDGESRRKAMNRIAEHTKQGGTFFCTLYNPSYSLKSADGNLKNLGKFALGEEKNLIVSYFDTFTQSKNLFSDTQYYEVYGHDNKLIEKRFMDKLLTHYKRRNHPNSAGSRLQAEHDIWRLSLRRIFTGVEHAYELRF